MSKKLVLIFGDKCNFNCTYCKENNNLNNCINLNFNKNIINYIKNNIKKYNEIIFWGGEPLLYWDKIKEIINLLPQINYKIISNGSLLTENIVSFLNQYNIKYVLSHDGINTIITRNINILDNEKILHLFKKIKNKRIQIVLTKYSQDFVELKEYYKKLDLYNECEFNCLMMFSKIENYKNLDEYNYDLFRKQIHYYLKVKNLKEKNKIAFAFLNQIPTSTTKCSLEYIENLGIDGNFYLCHELMKPEYIFGNINDKEEILNNSFKQLKYKVNDINKKERCNKCLTKDNCNLTECSLMHLEKERNSSCKLLDIIKEERNIINDRFIKS